ncbi:MAG: antitoxin VapB family protein [Nitrososphaerales archaeon]
MAHKTITISEEAYNALARMKRANESFTEVILRLASNAIKGNAQALLDFVKKLPISEDLAHNVEVSMMRTRKARLRKVKIN